MLPRPRIRLPLWAALVIPGAAYIARAYFVRGGDLSPDLPGDAVVALVVVAAVVLVGLARREARNSNSDTLTDDST